MLSEEAIEQLASIRSLSEIEQAETLRAIRDRSMGYAHTHLGGQPAPAPDRHVATRDLGYGPDYAMDYAPADMPAMAEPMSAEAPEPPTSDQYEIDRAESLASNAGGYLYKAKRDNGDPNDDLEFACWALEAAWRPLWEHRENPDSTHLDAAIVLYVEAHNAVAREIDRYGDSVPETLSYALRALSDAIDTLQNTITPAPDSQARAVRISPAMLGGIIGGAIGGSGGGGGDDKYTRDENGSFATEGSSGGGGSGVDAGSSSDKGDKVLSPQGKTHVEKALTSIQQGHKMAAKLEKDPAYKKLSENAGGVREKLENAAKHLVKGLDEVGNGNKDKVTKEFSSAVKDFDSAKMFHDLMDKQKDGADGGSEALQAINDAITEGKDAAEKALADAKG